MARKAKMTCPKFLIKQTIESLPRNKTELNIFGWLLEKHFVNVVSKKLTKMN